jgi:hypothetical protein
VASRFRGSDRAGDWPCRGEVILDLPAPVVSGYTRDGVVEELGPNRCRLILGSWSWAGSGRRRSSSTAAGQPSGRRIRSELSGGNALGG